MEYKDYYNSPLGKMIITADEIGVTGLWFEEHSSFSVKPYSESVSMHCPIFSDVKNWLDIYFHGSNPDFMPKLHQCGSEFQSEIWNILTQIPYGTTVTYKDIAQKVAKNLGKSKMSAQAVGNAIAHNNILILIPCHRVIGTKRNLTGYSGGIERKLKLLNTEHIDVSSFYFKRK